MTRERAAELIIENMKTVFAFAMSKVYDQLKSEELASDIIFELLRSCENIRDENAFFSFMWSVSNNVFKVYLRKRKKHIFEHIDHLEFDNSHLEMYEDTPENRYIEKEKLHILRRELTLLSSQYREATVKYYMDKQSCAEIAESMNISIEMVKYYLFKTRKILKEGIGMTREFGERSYKPGIFRPDKWNNSSSQNFRHLFDRKLPGNILLSAYYSDMSIQELSVELGVSVPYLEDDVDILINNDILKKLQNGKYRTNIAIFTEVSEQEIKEKTFPLCSDYSEKLFSQLSAILSEVRKINFIGNDYNDNRLLWTLITVCQYLASEKCTEYRNSKFGENPILYDGTRGFYYGFDHEYDYEHRLYNGVYTKISDINAPAELNIFNYRIIENCQKYRPKNWDEAFYALADAAAQKAANGNNNQSMCDLIDAGYIKIENGTLQPLFPVFSKDAFIQITSMLNDIVSELTEFYLSMSEISSDITDQHAPEFLKDKYKPLAYIRGNSGAYIINSAVEKQTLSVPDTNEKLCMFAILK